MRKVSLTEWMRDSQEKESLNSMLGDSAIQKNEVELPAPTRMGLEMLSLGEGSQTEANITRHHLHVES